ncbi:MAG: hypothetical protein LUD81_01295 [Clostridiales bacterium]|nr:hypothetical protein [Clostridiales bacterium]
MALTYLPSLSAAAYAGGTAEPSVSLEADSITLAEGETGTVSITLKDFENSASVNNLTFYAVFDPDIVEVSSVQMLSPVGTYDEYDETSSYINSVITSAHLTIDNSGVYTKDDIGKTPFEAGKIKFAFYSSQIISGGYLYAFDSDTAAANIVFKGVSAGTTPVSLIVVDCNSAPNLAEYASVDCTPVNGSVTVTGDTLDLTDAIQILQYAEDPSSLTEDEFAAADVYIHNVIEEKQNYYVLKQLISQQS